VLPHPKQGAAAAAAAVLHGGLHLQQKVTKLLGYIMLTIEHCLKHLLNTLTHQNIAASNLHLSQNLRTHPYSPAPAPGMQLQS
jgi:hypothetical protein